MDFNYLNEERKKLWEKIGELEKQIKDKSSDLELEIREHAENARQSLKKIATDATAISKSVEESDAAMKIIKEASKQSSEISENIIAEYKEIESKKSILSELDSWHTNAKAQFEELVEIYDNNPAMSAKLKEFEALCEGSKDLSSKIDGTHKAIISRKKEIDDLYYAIFGYIDEDEKTGEETQVKGLKDELEEAYRQLKVSFADHQKFVTDANESFIKRISTFEESKTTEFKDKLDIWNTDYDQIKARIEALLPNALTTGLSHAYSDKKLQEVIEGGQHAKVFRNSIIGMFVVSLIPLGVSIHALFTGVSLNETILRLPRLVLAILPLYIPVTWIAYSSNRKSNLSKRLIEEYSHKEALSKTYEGLSTQIASLGDNESARELKEKLLFIILEVSSENPGKLITDYNKSDHPVMDALDKSAKLTSAVEKLARIPGFTKLATILSDKADKIIDKQMEKAEKGLEATIKNELAKSDSSPAPHQ